MPRSRQSFARITTRPAEAVVPPVSPGGMPCRLSLPLGYEPGYPYPLMVLFHGRGGNEEHVQQLVPHVSQRNFLCLSLRGPEVIGRRPDGGPACTWSPGQFDADTEDALVRAIEWTCRAYHVHSERIYLAGICEGASVAYQIGLARAECFGGVIALNGELPPPDVCGPLFRMSEIRDFRVLIGHGIANAQIPVEMARRAFRALYAAGADVRLLTYPATHRLHARMLQDVNQWVIDRINAENDQLLID